MIFNPYYLQRASALPVRAAFPFIALYLPTRDGMQSFLLIDPRRT
jgi:hypothetical protein